MKLYRFCSYDELRKLTEGKTIHNSTDHYNGGKGGSTSRGFCLTEDEPEKAWKYLKGIVTPDVCLCLQIPRRLLIQTIGKYLGERINMPDGRTILNPTFKKEWCINVLKPEWLKEVIQLETFVPVDELEAARYIAKIKHKLPK